MMVNNLVENFLGKKDQMQKFGRPNQACFNLSVRYLLKNKAFFHEYIENGRVAS